jgi:pimeloyl-ACP methyl ester carboxylesterase
MPTAAGLYYFSQGEEDLARPPVILIHGAGGHQLYWPPQIRRLPGERIFAVDLPGHGKSPGVGHHAIADYAEAIVDFMDALHLNRAALVGHSMGGAVALETAIQWPNRVLGLVLIGSAAHLHVNPALLHHAADPAKEAEAVHVMVQYSFALETSARLQELAERRMLESRSSVLYGDLLACDAFDAADRARRLVTPMLVIFGSKDKMVSPGEGRVLADMVRGARMEVVPHAGHMVMLEQPARVSALLSEFLQGLPYQPGK